MNKFSKNSVNVTLVDFILGILMARFGEMVRDFANRLMLADVIDCVKYEMIIVDFDCRGEVDISYCPNLCEFFHDTPPSSTHVPTVCNYCYI